MSVGSICGIFMQNYYLKRYNTAKRIQLKVSSPCHENWDAMTPAEKGRFCNACQKQVIDFTGMSDAQLVAFFKKTSSGSACGRFIQDQLNRDIVIPQRRIPWLRYFVGLLIPAVLTASRATGQLPKPAGSPVMVTDRRLMGDTVLALCPEEAGRIITGRIIDEEEKPIAHVSVAIEGAGVSTITDVLGYFRLIYPGPAKKITMTVTGVGYEPRKQVIRLGKKPGSTHAVELKLSQATLGEVIVVGGYASVAIK